MSNIRMTLLRRIKPVGTKIHLIQDALGEGDSLCGIEPAGGWLKPTEGQGDCFPACSHCKAKLQTLVKELHSLDDFQEGDYVDINYLK